MFYNKYVKELYDNVIVLSDDTRIPLIGVQSVKIFEPKNNLQRCIYKYYFGDSITQYLLDALQDGIFGVLIYTQSKPFGYEVYATEIKPYEFEAHFEDLKHVIFGYSVTDADYKAYYINLLTLGNSPYNTMYELHYRYTHNLFRENTNLDEYMQEFEREHKVDISKYAFLRKQILAEVTERLHS